MKESDILYEEEPYWIAKAPKGKAGFEVYRVAVTHSVRVASIGFAGVKGMERARAEITRRLNDG